MDYLFFGIVVFGIGFLAGYAIAQRDAPKQDKSPFNYEVAPGHLARMHFIGNLSERKAKLLAFHVVDGKDFTGPALERRWKRGGFLSPEEFKGVREELIKLGLATRTSQKRVELQPSGRHFFMRLAKR